MPTIRRPSNKPPVTAQKRGGASPKPVDWVEPPPEDPLPVHPGPRPIFGDVVCDSPQEFEERRRDLLKRLDAEAAKEKEEIIARARKSEAAADTTVGRKTR